MRVVKNNFFFRDPLLCELMVTVKERLDQMEEDEEDVDGESEEEDEESDEEEEDHDDGDDEDDSSAEEGDGEGGMQGQTMRPQILVSVYQSKKYHDPS